MPVCTDGLLRKHRPKAPVGAGQSKARGEAGGKELQLLRARARESPRRAPASGLTHQGEWGREEGGKESKLCSAEGQRAT